MYNSVGLDGKMEIPVNSGSFTSGLTSRLVVTGILCWALAGTAYAVLRLTFGERPVYIHVRWAPNIGDTPRLQLEQRYQLARAVPRGNRTFGYALTDRSRDNIRNLVLDPAVEDTHEIHRTAFRVGYFAPRLEYVTPSPGMPVGLEFLSVLGFLGGLASISLALFKRSVLGFLGGLASISLALFKRAALARDWILSLATGGSQPLRFWLRIALVAAVLLLGVGLRAWRLGDQPAHNATADEYALTWAGMTLVANGTPQSWSWLDAYGTRSVIQWRGNPYPIVQPWMDHPPLYPLVMGLWMRVGGYIDPLSVDLRYMRVSSVLLFGLSFFLLKRFSNRPCTTWGGRGTSARTDAGGPMRAYSMDLRERALLDSDAGMTAADVAAKYRVSGSWVRLLKQRRRETGEVAPRVQRHGRRGMLEPHLHTVADLIAAHPDRTLAELKDALATPASVPTVWRAVRAIGLTVKKNGPPVRTRSA